MASVVLTGHSRGFGAALARRLLADGHQVLGVSRQPARDIVPSTGGSLTECQVDLSQRDQVAALCQGDTFSSFLQDKQAVLINNAGIITPIGPADVIDDHELLTSVMVNLTAAMMLSNAFLRITRECVDRRVLHISSGAGRSAYAGWSAYCAGKAGLDHYTRAVALEGHPGLRVESLAPGIMDTDMQALIRSVPADMFPMKPRFDQLKASGGLADPEETAAAIAKHLFSDNFGKVPCTDRRQIG